MRSGPADRHGRPEPLPSYSLADPLAAARLLEARFWQHALLAWVLVPMLVLAMSELIVPLKPTCSEGFSNFILLPMLLVEAHHLCAESAAWGHVKGLLAPGELAVLRQFGVLRKRRLLVILGILEGMDLYTDLMFPFVARACDADGMLTERWLRAWHKVPLIGPVATALVGRLHFWGCALCACGVHMVISGCWGLIAIAHQIAFREQRWPADTANPRISADIFYAWARSASTAMMPSVATLCEALADQRKWTYDSSKGPEDARRSTDGRMQLAFGKITYATQQQLELQNQEEQERVQQIAQAHYVTLLFVKVFLGNAISMWLQGSFLALTFNSTGSESRAKVTFSIAVSAATAVVRCLSVTGRLGYVGVSLSGIISFFIAWTALKVYFAFECPDHVWNLTTGCVDLSVIPL